MVQDPHVEQRWVAYFDASAVKMLNAMVAKTMRNTTNPTFSPVDGGNFWNVAAKNGQTACW